MPHYFFDTDDGTELYHDDMGTDLADDQAARDEGAVTLGEIAKEHLAGGPAQKNITMWVRSEDGSALLQLSMTFAIKPLR